MPQEPGHPAAGLGEGPVDLRDRIVATEWLLRRSRQRVTAAMAQVRHVDQLLHPGGQPPAAGPAGGPRSEHLTEVLHVELSAHLRAVKLHEQAARLQERWGWPERAAAARAHAAHARELSKQVRQELVSRQARVAAVDRAGQAPQRLP